MTKKSLAASVFAIPALLLAVLPQINSRAHAADACLSAGWSSNKITLQWYGSPGFALQQTTNLANPIWQDVPGSKGMSFFQMPRTNAMAFFRVANVDAFTDLDADLLDDWCETNGWDIVIDTHGYGADALVMRHVSSDPSMADTDGDGIEDWWEWIFGTDPRSADSDSDGLSDYEEWFKWRTSPTSVDTDGDARGPGRNLPPKAQLFDGNEPRLLHTSPTLEDTDGDGRTDYEEYDQPGRSPLLAEVPRIDVELVDSVDIRLDVEFAEEQGTSHEYGGELTVSDATRQQYSTESSINWSVTVGAEVELGLCPSGSVSTEVSVGGEVSVGFEAETSHSVERSHSDFLTDSRTRTETSASGSMSGGIRLINNSPVTYTITDLGMTVRYLQAAASAGARPTFQTLATLIPALGANGITLAPGDSTPVLQVSATGLNASRVKQFIARPNSLYLEPAFYELENADGLNFDYLEEVTRWRTARVQIDYGTGNSEEYRVATNVDRNEDGSYAGVTLGNVLSNILHIPFQTVPRRNLQTNSPTNERVLASVRSVTNATSGFWAVVWDGDGAPQTNVDFENIALQAGDQVLLVFVRDQDGDGLFGAEEQHYGTDDSAAGDSDADGLSDSFEVRTGWNVGVTNRLSYHVYSDPAHADQDGDGLTDAEERVKGTDPMKTDTDEDGLPDRSDTSPLLPAKVLRVKWDAVQGGNSATNGGTWNTALTNLQDALTLAQNGLNSIGDPADDIGEIWVAAGTYKPTKTNVRSPDKIVSLESGSGLRWLNLVSIPVKPP